jgi:hypothetical protein
MKSLKVRWAGHVTYTEVTRNSYRVLVGKPEGKRSFSNTYMAMGG